jgi:ABC-type transport system substrate-binding protein
MDMEPILVNTFNIANMDRVVEIVVTQLQEVGIPATAEVVEFGTWSDMYISGAPGSQVGERRVMLWAGCGGPTGFPLCWSQEGFLANTLGFDDPDVFTAIELANRTPDFDERDAILQPALSRVFGGEYWTINATPPISSVAFAAGYVKDYGLPWGFDNVCTTENNVWLDR